MKEQYLAPITKAIRFGIVGLAFLTPLFFLPLTSDFYQFNKQALVAVIATLLLILWGFKALTEGKLRITSNPLNLPILVFGIVFAFATFFSVDPYISIFGYYPRFNSSLILTLSYVIIFFVAVNNLDKTSRNWTFLALIASGFVLAVSGIVSFFGFHLLSNDFAASRTWTPIGNPNYLSLYLAMVLPLSIGYLFTSRNKAVQWGFLGLSLILLFPILLYGYFGPLLALVLGAIAAFFFFPRINFRKENRPLFVTLAVVVILLFLVINIPEMRKNFLEPFLAKKEAFTIQKETVLPLDSAWRISTQAVGQRPFLGVGPATFADSFTALKGQELNSDDFWNVRFDLSGNEYLTMLSSLGILGLLVFLYILVMFGRSLLNFNYNSELVKDNPTSVFLLSSFVVFVVGLFFQDGSATTFLFFILLAAGSYSFLKEWGVKNIEEMNVKLVSLNSGGLQFSPEGSRVKPDKTFGLLLCVLGIITALAIFYYGIPMYQAEIAYQKALIAGKENKAADTHSFLVESVTKNPYRDTYHRSLLVLDRLLAINLSKKENKNDTDNQNLRALASEALAQGTIITGYQGTSNNNFEIRRVAGTSPLNVANWEEFSRFLSSLNLEGDQKTQTAIENINVSKQAIALDPKNPILYESLGNILFTNNLIDNAIQSYQTAVSLRPTYPSAHYNLALALKQKGQDLNGVVNELQAALAYLPTDSSEQSRTNREQVQKDLKEAQDKLNASIAASQSAKPKTPTPTKK